MKRAIPSYTKESISSCPWKNEERNPALGVRKGGEGPRNCKPAIGREKTPLRGRREVHNKDRGKQPETS